MTVHPLREKIKAKGQAGWDELWQAKTTGWDRGQANVNLVELLERDEMPENINLPKKGDGNVKAVVAGCGRGYDAEAISRIAGWEAWGLDLSSTAIAEAESWYTSLPKAEPGSIKPGKVSFHAVDFFDFPIPEGGFQVAFDNTFFCALQPPYRSKWGSRYSAILPTAGSILITRVWPIMPPAEKAEADGQGPPWAVELEDYQEVLEADWKIVWRGDGGEKGMLVVWERL